MLGLGVASCTIETPDKEHQPRVEESEGGGNASGTQTGNGPSGGDNGSTEGTVGQGTSPGGGAGSGDASGNPSPSEGSSDNGSSGMTSADGQSSDTTATTSSGTKSTAPTTTTTTSSDSSSSCAKAQVSFDPVIPTIYILVDRSGSMKWSITSDDDKNPPAGKSRWDVVKKALLSQGGGGEPEGVIRRIHDQAYLTTSLYNSYGGDCPSMTHTGDGEPKLSNLLPIKAMFDSRSPSNGTPSAEAIYKIWEKIKTNSNENKIFVFATDGEPSNYIGCSDESGVSKTLPASVTMHDTQNDAVGLAKERAVRVVHQMRADGIPTFVIGVGPAATEPGLGTHLDEVARAGAGVNVYLQPGDPGYVPPGTASYPENPVPEANNGENDNFFFQGTSSTELYKAFESIIIGSRPCKFSLKQAILAGYEDTGELSINGEKVPLNDDNGWRVNNSTEIEVLGSSCEEIRKSANVDLQVEFSCEAVQAG